MENQILISQLDPASLKELIRATISEVLDNRAPETPETKYLTRLEVCDLYRISLPTVHEYIKKGYLKAHRMGRRVLFSEAELQQALHEIPTRKKYQK